MSVTSRVSSSPKKLLEQLTTVPLVAKYLGSTPFAVRHIQRIQLGSTNFTYRIFLEPKAGHILARTAILKYAAPFTADEPQVSFNSERQVFEARAMTLLPWQAILTPPNYKHEVSSPLDISYVKIPKVYFEDKENHVIMMEDGTPRNKTEEVWEEVSHSSRIFFEEVPQSSNKYETARVIGRQLGAFLARLHLWGKDPQNSRQTVESFAANTSAKDLTIKETFTDFSRSLAETGVFISGTLQEELGAKLSSLEAQVRNNLETLAMGDFWLGNVLLSFTSGLVLEHIYIIDWEFVMLAPVFLDIGNFLGEVFLIHYFESNDWVYIHLLEAFIESYLMINKHIDVGDILGYAGAHIIMALPRRMKSPRSRANLGNASLFVQHALNFLTGHGFKEVPAGEMGNLRAMLNIMRDRRQEMERDGKR
ncbi:kinase-like domain-containing protein [Rhexocercosporidium sp. MPI-PUGE-AT-0058]|nr:kinase-like domain-containing protein [Rhexocercosporidium sp. MPI-PUGE-AT-0058]